MRKPLSKRKTCLALTKAGRRRPVANAAPMHVALLLGVIVLSLMLATPPGRAQKPEITDEEITNAIESELWTDDAVNPNTVDVSTKQGIVTFTGTADSVLAKDRAAAIAETTVGVRGVVNRIEVAPRIERTDKELQNAVTDALLADPATDAYEIDASVAAGVVTLTGAVDSWAEKDLCSVVAKGVRGVKDVNNELDVDYKVTRSDYDIQEEIEARLANDVRIDDNLITVEVEDGEVRLSGTAGSLAEKRRARTDAWVAGVTSVDADALDIEWWARDDMRRKSAYTARSDDEIEQAVKDAFLYDPRVYSFEPDVEVTGGTVALRGTVDNLRAKRAAEQDARNVVGVWRVKNNLKVRPKVVPPDEELETRVADALSESPYINRYDVDVDVSSGWATLSGNVNTSFEAQEAERVAEGVKGVVRVFNNLDYEREWVWKPDWEIKADIEDQLFWSPFVDSDEISVKVDGGIVTLTGTVDTWAERQDAEENAYDGGAKHVNNNLVVAHKWYGPRGAYSPYGWPYAY